MKALRVPPLDVEVDQPEVRPVGSRVADVSGLLADCLMRRLPIGYCAIYLYDRTRTNLVKAAARGAEPAPPLRHEIPLVAGSPLPDFEVARGQPGGSLSLPLWDGRMTLGAIYARLGPLDGQAPSTVERGRIIAQSWAVTLSYVLEDGDTGPETPARSRGAFARGAAIYATNRHLTRYLETALARTCPDGPVTVAYAWIRGAGGRVRLPSRGVPLWPGDTQAGRPTGRAFGLSPGAGQAAFVWLRADPLRVRDVLRGSVGGRVGLAEFTGLRDEVSRWAATRLAAVGLAVYPEDAESPGGLLAAADDFHNLQAYLLSIKASNHSEGRETVSEQTGDVTAQVMDRLGLDREIDRQKQVLVQYIQSGLDFQDNRVRETSELLDRLIVVKQRHMGHRGAVP